MYREVCSSFVRSPVSVTTNIEGTWLTPVRYVRDMELDGLTIEAAPEVVDPWLGQDVL